MTPMLRSTAAAAALTVLVSVPVLADAPTLPLRAGEVATPSALAPGEQYLSIGKALTCGISTCTTQIKGRARKQTLITQISCLTVADGFQVLYGSVTKDIFGDVAVAILPVNSRGLAGAVEIAVVGGPTQIVIDPGESIALSVVATGQMQPGHCTFTGTTTKL